MAHFHFTQELGLSIILSLVFPLSAPSSCLLLESVLCHIPPSPTFRIAFYARQGLGLVPMLLQFSPPKKLRLPFFFSFLGGLPFFSFSCLTSFSASALPIISSQVGSSFLNLLALAFPVRQKLQVQQELRQRDFLWLWLWLW